MLRLRNSGASSFGNKGRKNNKGRKGNKGRKENKSAAKNVMTSMRMGLRETFVARVVGVREKRR